MKEQLKNKISLIVSALGFWLIASPMTFGYKCSKMWINDPLCGILLFLLGLCAFKTGRKVFYFGMVAVGFWLQLAPIFLWAPEATSYLNDTLIGIITIVLAFLLPGMTGGDVELGAENPEGWSFNPSSWSPRVVTVFLAMVCWFLARYLAAYQLGYITQIKDPFFGDGTVKVITSGVAHFFPASDAGLGAFVYSLEFLLGWMGSNRRWRTMPWLTVFFGAMVVPAGMMSILLIVLQPVLVGAWCGICLMIATCMLVMILLTVPEVVAVAQLLYRTKKAGKGFWSVFWKGDVLSVYAVPAKPIDRKGFSEHGFTCSWNLIASALIGVWLMCSPSILGVLHPAADSDYVTGPLLVAISIISMSEAIRSFRFANTVLGVALVISPFVLVGFSAMGTLNNLFFGVVIIALSFRKGKIRERYGVE